MKEKNGESLIQECRKEKKVRKKCAINLRRPGIRAQVGMVCIVDREKKGKEQTLFQAKGSIVLLG